MSEPTRDSAPSTVPEIVPETVPEPDASTALAFEDWVVSSGPGLMKFAAAMAGPAEAHDAVQDAMVAIYPRWRRLSREGAPDAYARRVIINRRITWWRRIGRRETVDPAPAAVTENHSDATSDAVLAVRLLRTLPLRQRAAVVLRYYDDLDFAEISRILGCAESTARSHVHRALATLRAELGEDDD